MSNESRQSPLSINEVLGLLTGEPLSEDKRQQATAIWKSITITPGGESDLSEDLGEAEIDADSVDSTDEAFLVREIEAATRRSAVRYALRNSHRVCWQPPVVGGARGHLGEEFQDEFDGNKLPEGKLEGFSINRTYYVCTIPEDQVNAFPYQLLLIQAHRLEQNVPAVAHGNPDADSLVGQYVVPLHANPFAKARPLTARVNVSTLAEAWGCTPEQVIQYGVYPIPIADGMLPVLLPSAVEQIRELCRTKRPRDGATDSPWCRLAEMLSSETGD